MDTTFTIEQFDNGITLRAEDTAIVIPNHSVNTEIGRLIMRDVTASMNNTKKVVLTIKIESDEQQ